MSDDQSARQTTVDETGDELEEGSSADETDLRRTIRDLAANLVHDILAAVASASAAELGELIRLAPRDRGQDGAQSSLDGTARLANETSRVHREAMRSELTSSPREGGRSAGGDVSGFPWKRRAVTPRDDRLAQQAPIRQREADARAQPATHDPFDITSPHELLASTDELSPQPQATADSTDGSHEAPRPTALPSLLQQPATESSTALVESDSDAASERRPRVVLRAGERLLSATGSGVVIGRERRER
jgi:hypothetical protein